MRTWTGILYASGTITITGDSGWLDLWAQMGQPSIYPSGCFKRASLYLRPADLAGDETLDIDLNMAWTSSGGGDLKLHDFTQITNTNVAQFLILPGGESANALVVATDLVDSLLTPYWKFSHTLAGTTKSMQYTVYATMEW